jgi:peroxiredoxin
MSPIDFAAIRRQVWRFCALAFTGICFGICGMLARNAMRDEAPHSAKVGRQPEGIRWPKTPRMSRIPEHGGTIHFDLLAKLLSDDRRSVPTDEWRRELDKPNPSFRIATQSHPLVGRAAPDFTLSDHRGKTWTLSRNLKHGPLVLVFYLGYYCNFCVHDLFELNADLDRFHTLGGQVVAISGDSPDMTRQRFARFGSFGFSVLSDPRHVVAQSYGMFQPGSASSSEGLLHGTFVIGSDGIVRWAHFGSLPFRNDMALLYEIAKSEKGRRR